MILDLQLVVYSYLSLEELLTTTSPKLRDLVIKRYFLKLPTIEESVQLGDLQTFIHLCNLGYKYDPEILIHDVINSGDLKFLEYILNNMIISKHIWVSNIETEYLTNNLLKILLKYNISFCIYSVIDRLSKDPEIVNILENLQQIPNFHYLLTYRKYEPIHQIIHNKYIGERQIMHWRHSKIDLEFMEYI